MVPAGWKAAWHASFERWCSTPISSHVAEFLRPVVVNEAELALDAIRESARRTFLRLRSYHGALSRAFYAPMISDWRNYESWTEAGQPTAYDGRNRLYKSTLASYQRRDERCSDYWHSARRSSGIQTI